MSLCLSSLESSDKIFRSFLENDAKCNKIHDPLCPWMSSPEKKLWNRYVRQPNLMLYVSFFSLFEDKYEIDQYEYLICLFQLNFVYSACFITPSIQRSFLSLLLNHHIMQVFKRGRDSYRRISLEKFHFSYKVSFKLSFLLPFDQCL